MTQSTEEIQWGALGVIGIERENMKLTFSGLYTRDSSDTVTREEDTRGKEYYFPGYDPNDPDSPGSDVITQAPYQRTETLLYRERETTTWIVQGEHTLPDPYLELDGFIELLPPVIDWTIAESRATLNEPDRRQFGTSWINRQFIPGFPPFFPDTNIPARHIPRRPASQFSLGNLQRIDKSIRESSSQYAVNFKFPFSQWTGDEGYFKFGFYQENVDRSFKQDSFTNFRETGQFEGEFEDEWGDVWEDEDHFISEALIDVNYDGESQVDAIYYMADIPLTSWLNVIGGVRFENTEISIVNDPEENATWVPPGAAVQSTLLPGEADVNFEQQDELPALGLRITPIEQIVFRANYSETIARQTFRELTPITQQEFLGGDIFIGNPSLQPASLRNYDLRLDYTPYKGGLVSASWFYKDIEDPIEVIQRPAIGFTFTTPVNYPEGEISGFEFEIRQDLGRFANFMEGMTIGANATLIDSEVTIPEDEQIELAAANVPEESRDATNAPEYLYNLYMLYNFGKLGSPGTDASIFYTVRGDTLIAGSSAINKRFVPSVYETEFATLNASLNQDLGAGFSVKLAVKNILDPDIESVYRSDYIESDVVRESFKKGREYSIGLSATF